HLADQGPRPLGGIPGSPGELLPAPIELQRLLVAPLVLLEVRYHPEDVTPLDGAQGGRRQVAAPEERLVAGLQLATGLVPVGEPEGKVACLPKVVDRVVEASDGLPLQGSGIVDSCRRSWAPPGAEGRGHDADAEQGAPHKALLHNRCDRILPALETLP